MDALPKLCERHFGLISSRLRGVMGAKKTKVKRQDLVDLGYSPHTVDDWLYRKGIRTPNLSAEALVKIAIRLQVPAEYLVGAPCRFDENPEDYRRVVVEGSLEFFLGQTKDGRRVNADIVAQLRQELTSEDPPTTELEWRARWETIVRSARWGQVRDASLDQMVQSPQESLADDTESGGTGRQHPAE